MTDEKRSSNVQVADTVLVWRARPDCGGAWLYDDNILSLAALLADGAEGGMAYEIEAVEMTKEQWAAVPDDFPGW